MNYIFEIELEVRDYECDIQGIVNNSVYQNYFEHARHKFLHSVDLDFAELHNQGFDGVVTNVDIAYKNSLVSGDSFIVKIAIEKQGHLRMIFNQDIIHKETGKLMARGKITTVFKSNGRPVKPDIFVDALRTKGIDFKETV